MTRCFWVADKCRLASDHLNLIIRYNVAVRYEKPCGHIFYAAADRKGEMIYGKNNSTELVFIIDRSGSMSGLEKDTIGVFNSMIEKQRKEEGECYVSTILFDHETKVLHDRVKLSEVRPMTEEDYTVRGTTALIDALGGAIHHIGNVHKYARPEDVPAHTMFVITTDGMENASRRYIRPGETENRAPERKIRLGIYLHRRKHRRS